MLHSILLLFLLLAPYTLAQGNQCQSAFTRCQATCSRNGVNGEVLNATACPVANDVNGDPRPRCNVCVSGQHCDTATGTCKLNSEIEGRACTVDENCMPYVPDYLLPRYECLFGSCAVASEQSLFNDDCSTNSDCVGSMICTSGKCATALSGACATSRECAVDEACIAGFCTSITFSGSCSVSPNACLPSQVCNPVTSVCVNVFTLSDGTTCSQTAKHEMFACTQGAVCTQVSLGSTLKTCENAIALPNGCAAGSDIFCTTQSVCACNPESGRGECYRRSYAQNCASSWNSYLRCAENNNCRWEGMTARPGTCIRNSCAFQFATLIQCTQLIGDSVDFNSTCAISSNVLSITNVPPVEDSASVLTTIFL